MLIKITKNDILKIKKGKFVYEKNKILSIVFALTIIFTCTFSNVCEAAQSHSTSYKSDSVKQGTISKSSSIKSGNYMYYSTDNRIYKVNIKTKKSTLVYKGKNREYFNDLTVKDGWIYCTKITMIRNSETYEHVFKVKTNGKSAKVLKKGMKPVIYKGNIYYIKEKFDEKTFYSYLDLDVLGIYKMSLSGKNDKCIKKSDAVDDFVVYKSKIYYTSIYRTSDYDYNYKLYTISTSGGKSKMMFNAGEKMIMNIKAYSDYIYFTMERIGNGEYSYDIHKIKINSTKKTKVVSDAYLQDISKGYIYYGDYSNYDQIKLGKMKISNKKKTYIKLKGDVLSGGYIEDGYMIIYTFIEESDNLNNVAVNLCSTDGKNIKVLKKFYLPEYMIY